MAKHCILAVSANDDFKMEYPDGYKVSYGQEIDVEYYRICGNRKSLASVYNDFIEARGPTSDFIYLMHSDVSLDIEGLVRHVEAVQHKYDVIGLCGCARFSVGQTPLNWFCGSRPFPEYRWGSVRHGELKNTLSFFSNHSPDTLDHEVACIDGLCIILSHRAVESGLRFDTEIGMFDCYDTDISLQAVLKYKLRLGVVVRKDLVHYSVGRSILGVNFLKTELKLRKKWGFDIPPNSAIEKLSRELSNKVN